MYDAWEEIEKNMKSLTVGLTGQHRDLLDRLDDATLGLAGMFHDASQDAVLEQQRKLPDLLEEIGARQQEPWASLDARTILGDIDAINNAFSSISTMQASIDVGTPALLELEQARQAQRELGSLGIDRFNEFMDTMAIDRAVVDQAWPDLSSIATKSLALSETLGDPIREMASRAAAGADLFQESLLDKARALGTVLEPRWEQWASLTQAADALKDHKIGWSTDAKQWQVDSSYVSTEDVLLALDEVATKDDLRALSAEIQARAQQSAVWVLVLWFVLREILLPIGTNLATPAIQESLRPREVRREISRAVSQHEYSAEELRHLRIVLHPDLPVYRKKKRASGQIATLDIGQVVWLLERKRNWAYVLWNDDTKDGTAGWVFARYLAKPAAPPSTRPRRARPTCIEDQILW